MPGDEKYDILFEPVRIGPVRAKNRFYQVRHCNGMGYHDPTALATMRGVKAEGGWGVVCIEQVLVTARLPNHNLRDALRQREEDWPDAGLRSLTVIGDALAPGTIAAAVFCGRRYAKEWGEPKNPGAAPSAARSRPLRQRRERRNA